MPAPRSYPLIKRGFLPGGGFRINDDQVGSAPANNLANVRNDFKVGSKVTRNTAVRPDESSIKHVLKSRVDKRVNSKTHVK